MPWCVEAGLFLQSDLRSILIEEMKLEDEVLKRIHEHLSSKLTQLKVPVTHVHACCPHRPATTAFLRLPPA